MIYALFNRIKTIFLLLFVSINFLLFSISVAKASGIDIPIYEQNAQSAKRKHYVDFKKIKTSEFIPDPRLNEAIEFEGELADPSNLREHKREPQNSSTHLKMRSGITKEAQDNPEANQGKKIDIKTRPHERLANKNLQKPGETEEKLQESEANGTKIALKKELKRYSRELELYLISSMWKFAYFSSKDEDDQDFTEKLYSDQYIARIVEQAYGENGGRLADAMYEKMLMQQGLDFDKEFNSEDKSERSIEGVRLSQ